MIGVSTQPMRTALAVAVSLIPGCLSPSPSFVTHYLLTTADRSGEDQGSSSERTYRLALERVDVPTYLQTEWIVIRVGTNEIVLDEERRWAEPLGDGVMRLVRETLQRSPKIARVDVPPFRPRPSIDYRVRVRLLSFEGEVTPDGASAVRVEARWKLTPPEGDLSRDGWFSERRRTWDGESYEQLARRLSEALIDLCRDIEASLGEDP